MMDMIQSELNSHKDVLEKLISNLQNYIYTASIILNETINNNNKILIFGNDISMINAKSLTFKINNKNENFVAVVLSYDKLSVENLDVVFEKQVELLANKDDLLIGISTSGNSKNILRALSFGKSIGCKTIGLSGYDGGAMNNFCDLNIVVPSDDKSRIEEAHMFIGNIISKTLTSL